MNEDKNNLEGNRIVAEVAAEPLEAAAQHEAATEAAAALPGHAEPTHAAVEADPRMNDLERRIRELEAAIGDLRTVTAAASVSASGRKTQVASAPRLLSKGKEPVHGGDVDAALGSLSVEQRFAVKAGLLRAGLL